MNAGRVEEIADAVLYEGYLLYPYRASALKNRQRWNFGVVYPRGYSEAQAGTDPWSMQTQCLVTGGPLTAIQMNVRFLRLVERIASAEPDTPWQEAAKDEIRLPQYRLDDLAANSDRRAVSFCEGHLVDGHVARRRYNIEGVIELRAEQLERGLWRITVRIENLTPWSLEHAPHREAVLLQSLVSTHTILSVSGGEFLSLLDPPEAFREAAGACNNIGTWPVLAGDAPQRDTMLSSPIILYDYPQVAPESPGALFDGTEIDEILTLRILTMTEQEKEEARRTDEGARRILDRTEGLSPEDFLRLHGVLRTAIHTGADI
jgi:hypothetical protein